MLPTDVEHAGGLEKWELLAKEAGNDVSKNIFGQVRIRLCMPVEVA